MRFFMFTLLLFFIQQSESTTILNGVCLDCQSKILVPAAGSSTAAPIIRQLAFSFGLVQNEIEVNYISQSMENAMERLQNPCRKNYELDFAALDYSLGDWKDSNPLESSDLVAIPLLADALVFTYNLPDYDLITDPAIIFSREVIYGIFMGDITLWDDPRLLEINPLLRDFLPHANISLILRDDPNGSAGAVMTMLKNLDPTITGTFTKWPPYFFNMSNRLRTQGSNGVIATIMTHPYSLGLLAQSYADEAGLPQAKIKNKEGNIIPPGKDLGVYDAILRASEDLQYQETFELDELNPADQEGNGSYPLSALVRLVYHTEVNANCDARIAMAKFINWMLTDQNALIQIFAYPGFIPLPEHLVELVLAQLKLLHCDGEQLLKETFVDFGNNSLTQTIIIFATVLIVISVAILSTLSYKRNNRITRAAGLAFAFFFLLGCIFNYISVIFFAEIPLNSSICQARYGFVTLGYALILGAMFAKCWEISRIFQRAESGDISPFQEIPWWMFCRAFFGVVFFEALFLFVWFIVDPPQTAIVIIDSVNILAVHECSVKHAGIWYAIHFSYFAIVLVWGAYLAYQTRDIWQKYNYPNESRSILMSIYNLAFCAVILVPLVTVLGASPSVLFFLIAVAIIFPTTFALVVVHGPKMAAFIASSVRGSKGSKGSKQGTGHEKATERERSRRQNQGNQVDFSHTVKLLQPMDEPAKSGEKTKKSMIQEEEIEMMTPLKGTRSIEDPKLDKEGPPLSSSWKVLTPAVVAVDPRGRVGSNTDLEVCESPDLAESRNPLFDDGPTHDL